VSVILQQILDNYNDVQSGVSDKRCVCIHGERNSGKTALLKELKNKLQNVDVYYSINQKNDAFREILEQFINTYKENFNPKLIDFITRYINKKLNKNEEYTKQNLAKTVYDCLLKNPAIIIIDDIDQADDFTIGLFERLLDVDINLYLIFTCCYDNENEKLTQVIKNIAKKTLGIGMEKNNIQSKSNKNINLADDYKSQKTHNIQASSIQALNDEAKLVLKKPGNEKQLIKHYINTANEFIQQMNYKEAAIELVVALEVACNIKDTVSELEIITKLGENSIKDDKLTTAIEYFNTAHALAMTDDLPLIRAVIASDLADCYLKIHDYEKMREYIMLTEGFFCIPENREENYDLYKTHILRYLLLLSELNEITIFSEKIKQASEICKKDDESFRASLIFEEGYMFLQIGNFLIAHEKLLTARDLAEKSKNNKVWDGATNSLAICNEYMDKPEVSKKLWLEQIDKSYDPVKIASAMINTAIMQFERTGDKTKLETDVTAGIQLCIVINEITLANEYRTMLKEVLES
jgi:hypothetical protein